MTTRSRAIGKARATGTAPLVVTGGAGFIGCNLVDRLAAEGNPVLIVDSLARAGVGANLEWLLSRWVGRVRLVQADVRDVSAMADLIGGARGVFHLAAQTAVTTSLEDVREDLEINLLGTINVLEAARASPLRPPVLMASTNKVYGDLSDIDLELSGSRYLPKERAIRAHGISEARPLSFHTPYGCSKGAADQYVLDYARSFGVAGVVLRMSCIYGPHQCGSEDQGWVSHFASAALSGAPIRIFGDGRQVRDVLYVGDCVEAYVRAFRAIERVRGRAFNVGGGPANAVSLLDVIDHLALLSGRSLDVSFHDWRPGDQRFFVSDTRSIGAMLDLSAPRPWRNGLALMLESLGWRRATPPLRSRRAGEERTLR